MAVASDVLGFRRTSVAHIRAAKHSRVRIENLTINAPLRNADAIEMARHGREVTSNHYKVAAILGEPHKSDDARVRIAKIDPLKAGVVVIDLMQGGLAPVQRI